MNKLDFELGEKNDFSLIEKTIKELWDKDTCHPDLVKRWKKESPYIGQSDVTALLVQDYRNGVLAINDFANHVWNIFPKGERYDLAGKEHLHLEGLYSDRIITREELLSSPKSQEAQVQKRYLLLRSRVEARVWG